MARPTPPPDTTLSEQAALNAIVRGVSFARSTDTFVNDVKGATLALSVTNASKAVPAGVRAISMWADVAFRYRINTAADLTDGAFANALDVITMAIDPNDTVGISTVQAILASGSGTLTLCWVYGT
jgi:hypothetical protein